MLIPIDKLLQRYNIPIQGIIHCGSSTGQERQHYADLGVEKVIWVEAIPEVYNELLENLKPFPNQIAVNACVAEVDGREVVFHVSNNEAQSSSFLPLGSHKTAHPEVHYVREFNTTTKTLKTVLSELGIEIGKNWLLCGDIQGAEYLMLQGAGDLLNRFEACYLEVNTQAVYEGCGLKHEIEEYLSGYGFIGVDEMIYPQWGWGDKFFIKEKYYVQ